MSTSVDSPAVSRPRAWDWGVYALIAFFSLVQEVGRTTLDTRVELSERPAAFLAGGFSLWHDATNFGELLNQAYGYIFPQGAFFVLVDWSGLPPWIGQRLWCALVLLVAFEGARRCAHALGLRAGPASLAGLVFALSPRMVGTVGVISAESLPGAVMPWVVLPVLLAARGRLSPSRAAVLSGAAVVCMGGVNAVEVIGSLPVPLIFVAWITWRALLPRRFLLWWGGAVAAACTWWVLPLLVLGRYSPPFYEYVESASNTTGVIGWSEALRGDSHWVGFISVGGQAWWPAAHSLMFDPWLVLAAACVSAVGLLGLARFPSVMRWPLVCAATVGLAALTIAHGGWEGSPVSGFFLDALEGPLQVFRNVHKVDPTARFAVAMGFAHAVTLAAAWSARHLGTRAGPHIVPVLAAALVLVLGQPFFVNETRTPGWKEVPASWRQAYDYLAERQDGTATLVVPGSGFALQTWGWTVDEPMHALGDDVRWASRSQVPIIPGQSIRVLTALDTLVSQGQADGSLGRQLARAGIGHVLVRRDLNRGFTSSPPPAGAGVSLASGGLESVASFGSIAGGSSALEIYRVPERLPPIRATVREDVETVAGAPEAWVPLLGTGLIEADGVTVSAGEPGWSGSPTVVTDTNQRRERAFGRVEESLSTVLEAEEPYRLDRSVPDYPGSPGGKPVVARYEGGASVRASSSQGYADAYGSVVPQAGPHAAFDGNTQTRWISSLSGKAREQWLRVDFPAPRRLSEVSILPVMDDATMAPIRRLQVRTARESITLEPNPTGAAAVASLSGEPVERVEIRVLAASTTAERDQLAVAEVSLDGQPLRRTLVLPDTLDRGDSLLLTGGSGTRACRATGLLPDCDIVRTRGSEEPEGLRRSVSVSQDVELQLEGLVVARATRASAQLLEPFLSEQQVGATSIYGDDPLVASRFAYDDRSDTQWLAAPNDPEPTMFFRWQVPRRITAINLPLVGSVNPGYTRVVLRSEDRIEKLTVTGETTRLSRPMRTKALQVSFVKDVPNGVVAVPEIDLEGGGVRRPFDPDLPTGAICGLGPPILVAGKELATRVDGTLGDVLSGAPMRLRTCRPNDPDAATPTTALYPGSHIVGARPTAEFEVVAITGRAPGTSDTRSRPVRVEEQHADRARAQVGPGPEAVVSVPWNFNTGWVARLEGRELPAVRVDGWHQGWVLPSGAGGELRIDFAPQQGYGYVLVAGLLVSGSLLLGALGLLLRGRMRRRGRDVSRWREWPEAGTVPLGLRLALAPPLVLLLGWVACAAYALGSLWRRHDLHRMALASAVLVVASGALDAWPQPVPGSVADASAVAGFSLALGLALRRWDHVRGAR